LHQIQPYFFARIPPQEEFEAFDVKGELDKLDKEGDSAGMAQVLKAQV